MKTITVDGHAYKIGEKVCIVPVGKAEEELSPKDIEVYVIDKNIGWLYLLKERELFLLHM